MKTEKHRWWRVFKEGEHIADVHARNGKKARQHFCTIFPNNHPWKLKAVAKTGKDAYHELIRIIMP